MKVLFISRRYYPDIIGGGQMSAFYIAKAVKKQGNDVYVCTFSNGKKAKTNIVDGIKIFRLQIPKLKLFPRLSNMDYMYLQMAKLSSKIIEKVKPDIIHLLNFESVPLSAPYLKKKIKKPIVATVNTPMFGCFTGGALDYKKEICIKCCTLKRYLCSVDKWGKIRGSFYYTYSLWYMNLLKFSYNYVDRFFAVSKAMIILLEGMGVSKEKISVVHNPIELQKKVKTNLRKKLKIRNKKVILYAGRLTKEKGIQHTIKSMQHLDKVVFIVAGKKNNYYTNLTKLVKKLKIEDKVKFVGFVKKDKLFEYYSIADVVVLTCSIYDSFSRLLLEACSFGIPVVASDVGGNPEIVVNGKNGFLLKNLSEKEIANKIKKAVFNLQKSSVKNYSKNLVENNFSLDVVGNRILREYELLLKKSMSKK